MVGMILGMMLAAAAQDVPPLAGTLPPLPPRRSATDQFDRPRGRLFISPMGEPFRASDPIGMWFDQADSDHDGGLTRREFEADAARFFAVLDRGKDGEIDPDDIDYYEARLVPEIRVGGAGGGGAPARASGGGRRGGGGGRRGGRNGGGPGGSPGGEGGGDGGGSSSPRYVDVRRGAALYGFFDFPEPVTVADTNFNRGVDPLEFKKAADQRFDQLDKKHDGRITRGELPRLTLPEPGAGRERPGRGDWRSLKGRKTNDDNPPPKDGADTAGDQ